MNLVARVKEKCMNYIQRKFFYLHCDIVIKEKSELLKNEVVLVTGGGSGIGRAIAIKSVQEGAKVIVLGRREEKLKETCAIAGNENCKYIVFDMSTDTIDKTFWKTLEKKFGREITCLVNNAGVYLTQNVFRYEEKIYDTTMRVNLKGTYRLTQDFMCYLIEKNIKGKIIFIASNRGVMGDSVPYGISKSAIIHYTKGLAKKAIPYNIRVNAVAPGMTTSEINGLTIKDNLYNSGVAGKRTILAEEIAEVVNFLLSPISNCINGAIIPCDEGEYLK